MSHSQAFAVEQYAEETTMPQSDMTAGEPFPIEEIASATPEGAAAFRDQTAVLRAAAWIREMREAAGFTQRDLAKLVGTSQPYLSELERGTGTQGPTFLMLEKIATACGRVLRVEVAVQEIAEHQELRRTAA